MIKSHKSCCSREHCYVGSIGCTLQLTLTWGMWVEECSRYPWLHSTGADATGTNGRCWVLAVERRDDESRTDSFTSAGGGELRLNQTTIAEILSVTVKECNSFNVLGQFSIMYLLSD